MKSAIYLKLCIIIFLGIWGCQSQNISRENPQTIVEYEKNKKLERELSEIKTLKDLANRSLNMSDTLGAEFYYSRAISKLDTLEYNYGDYDNFLSIKNEITDLYGKLFDDITLGINDSISTSHFLQDIDLLDQESDSMIGDSTTVKITDVIDESHQMAIPLVLNKKVERSIEYFTRGRGRKVFTIWLQRSGLYEKLIKEILKEEGVPEELFYLAMIESGLRTNAHSWARAVGVWQFIAGTGRMYGLRQSWWYDERRDPIKATRAAARHLKDLHKRFNDWYLAMAGYNYSPGKIERRLRNKNVNDYWDLPRLPRETRNYVPTFIAAATIAQNPAKYGFDVTPFSPLEIDTVTVKECVDLNVVARCIVTSFTEVKNINPALLRWCTPPDREEWVLNLPKGSREQFLENYISIPNDQKLSYVHHRIRSGETLSSISRRYHVSISEIKRFNKINGTLIRAGHSLVIPVPQSKSYYRSYTQSSYAPASSSSYSRKVVANVPGREKKEYIVKKGDTLWNVAQRYDVTVKEIRKWNGLGYTRIIRPSQKLNIWVKPGSVQLASQETQRTADSTLPAEISSNTIIHTVRSGDTLWDISLNYNVSIRNIKKWNKKRNNVIKPGEKLKIVTSS
jgi:membrane-bound lytic murein transglycosylase D